MAGGQRSGNYFSGSVFLFPDGEIPRLDRDYREDNGIGFNVLFASILVTNRNALNVTVINYKVTELCICLLYTSSVSFGLGQTMR